MAVAGGEVTVAGPPGYCVDRAASRETTGGAFVLFGSCASLTGSAGAGPAGGPAILTASVLPGETDATALTTQFTATARFFRSPPGRAALSRSGRADDVVVADILSVGDVLYIRLKDTALAAGKPVEPDYWRAVLVVRGHMVSLSVLGPRGKPLTDGAKRRVLDAFVARMRATNT
ncbi:MAG: hypothetical protein KDE08_06955 [Rhodobacteraceae bacterium]|nr:hypothetical protein [Paracoccaceae bacterium]